MRSAVQERATAETSARVELALDDFAMPSIRTGCRMFDHLLAQWAFHSKSTLHIEARSLDGIQHHLVEDIAIVLGRALDEALGDRRGITRYASATIPMDDALVRAAVDFGGRSYCRTALSLSVATIEDLNAGLIAHALSSLAVNARICLHVDQLAGTDPHHGAEAAFKALARASRSAWSIAADTPLVIPSTKGAL
jgi:imidazoleglycerol-phosphate dehydratase